MLEWIGICASSAFISCICSLLASTVCLTTNSGRVGSKTLNPTKCRSKPKYCCKSGTFSKNPVECRIRGGYSPQDKEIKNTSHTCIQPQKRCVSHGNFLPCGKKFSPSTTGPSHCFSSHCHNGVPYYNFPKKHRNKKPDDSRKDRKQEKAKGHKKSEDHRKEKGLPMSKKSQHKQSRRKRYVNEASMYALKSCRDDSGKKCRFVIVEEDENEPLYTSPVEKNETKESSESIRAKNTWTDAFKLKKMQMQVCNCDGCNNVAGYKPA